MLISESIITYSEFMEMPYHRFKKLEDFIIFKNSMINRGFKKEKANQNKQEIKAKLNSLPIINMSDMGFSNQQIKDLRND